MFPVLRDLYRHTTELTVAPRTGKRIAGSIHEANSVAQLRVYQSRSWLYNRRFEALVEIYIRGHQRSTLFIHKFAEY